MVYLAATHNPGLVKEDYYARGRYYEENIIKQMASAEKALHSRGYVHRDLKPGNVMVSSEGFVTLLDFGLIHFNDVFLDAQRAIVA